MKYFVRYKSYATHIGMFETYELFDSLEEANECVESLKGISHKNDEIGVCLSKREIYNSEDAEDVYYANAYEEIKKIIC